MGSVKRSVNGPRGKFGVRIPIRGVGAVFQRVEGERGSFVRGSEII